MTVNMNNIKKSYEFKNEHKKLEEYMRKKRKKKKTKWKISLALMKDRKRDCMLDVTNINNVMK